MDNGSQQAEELEALDSIYGAEWKKDLDNAYSIRVASDVELFITLNPLYPSEAPPTYQLLAPGLSKTVKNAIANACEEIYLDNIGGPVLFQWIEKVKEIVLADSNDKVDVINAETPAKVVDAIEDDCSRYNIVHGAIIQDRKSIFQGHVCSVKSEEDVRNVLNCLLSNKKIAQATHNICAHRLERAGGSMVQDCDDDGESHAGGRLLHLLQIVDAKDVVVVVSRWYGGVQLGPDRFRHINNAARTVLQAGGFIK